MRVSLSEQRPVISLGFHLCWYLRRSCIKHLDIRLRACGEYLMNFAKSAVRDQSAMRDIWLKPRNPPISWIGRTFEWWWIMSSELLLVEKLFHFPVPLNFCLHLNVHFDYKLSSQSEKRLVDICSIQGWRLNERDSNTIDEFLLSTSQIMIFYLGKCITDLSLVDSIRFGAHNNSTCTLLSITVQKFKPAFEIVERTFGYFCTSCTAYLDL